jgi:hypothetical protein
MPSILLRIILPNIFLTVPRISRYIPLVIIFVLVLMMSLLAARMVVVNRAVHLRLGSSFGFSIPRIADDGADFPADVSRSPKREFPGAACSTGQTGYTE